MDICSDCTIKNTEFYKDLLASTFDITKVQIKARLLDYITLLPPTVEQLPEEALYSVWYPAFIYPETSVVYDVGAIGILPYIDSEKAQLNSFEVDGELRAAIDWNLNFKGPGFYDQGVLFWYRYWDMQREDDTRIIPGMDIYISDGDFVVFNGAPHVTPNLEYSASLIKQYLRAYSSNVDICDLDYLSKLLASGPQIDFVTEVLVGNDRNCPASPYPVDHRYPRDIYARILPFLQLMSDAKYDDFTTIKYIDSYQDLITKLLSKYGGYLYALPNSVINLLSKFTSLSGANVSIETDVQSRKLAIGKSSYNLSYQVGDLSFSTASTGTVYPEKLDNGFVVGSEIPFVANNFYVNNSIIGSKLTTLEEDFLPDIKKVSFHGLGGVNIETDTKVGYSDSLKVRFGGLINLILTNQGSGYTSAPSVQISGGGGSGAKAVAYLLPGSISSISIQNGGEGYFEPPLIFISGGGGFGAAAEAIVENGVIIGVNMTSNGTGYTSQPLISIIGCGQGATLVANFEGGGVVGKIELTDPGAGYTEIPTITISGGGGNGATATASLTGFDISYEEEDLPELSSDGNNFCTGSAHTVFDSEVPDGVSYVRISGTAKDALIVNGEIVDCGLKKSNTELDCNNGTHRYTYITKVSGNLKIEIKHNTGTTSNADLKVLFGQTVSYDNIKSISNIPFFTKSIDNNRNNQLKIIDRDRTRMLLSYSVGNNTILIFNSIDIKYLRSNLKPTCPAFIEETNQQELKCTAIKDIYAGTHYLKNNVSTTDGSFTPGISSYFAPYTYYYGGLTPQQVADNNVYIVTPEGQPYHPSPGTLIEKTHDPIPDARIVHTYKFDGCNNETITIPMPFIGYITVTDMSIRDNVNFKISWGDKTSEGGYKDTIGLLKTAVSPDFFTFSVTTSSEEDPEQGIPDEQAPSVSWSASINIKESEKEEIVIPVAPALIGTKGFFHPNFGWTNDQKYLNKTARILNYRPNIREDRYIYDYNSHYLYNSQYQKGYNYMFDFSGSSLNKILTATSAKNIGILTEGGGFFISPDIEMIHYTPDESLILQPAKFDYISLDSYLYNGSTLLNDLSYTRVAPNGIKISSSSDPDRLKNYLDSLPYIDHGQFVLYNGYAVNENNYIIVQALEVIDGEYLILEDNLPDPEDGFNFGFIQRMPHAEDGSHSSVLVYRPRNTYNDPYYKTGKWGHLSYGNAVQESLKYIEKKRYNLITLKTSLSNNSALTWSNPIVFYNNFNPELVSWYQPICNRRLNENNTQGLYLLSYDPPNFSTLSPDTDQTLAATPINYRYGNFYIGPYVGNLHVRCYLENISAIDSSGRIFTVILNIQGTEIPFVITSSIGYVDFYVNKESPLPIFGFVSIVEEGQECVASSSSTIEIDTPIIGEVRVGVIASEDLPLRNRTKISFYKHKIGNDTTNGKYLSFDATIGTPLKHVCGNHVSPLTYYQNLLYLLNNRSIDFSAFMDMHIFSFNTFDRPIRHPYGNVFFEDFLEPVSENTFNSAGYNINRYWINIPRETEWKYMSSKGIIFERDKIYKTLIYLDYGCTESASACAGIYKTNICNDIYSMSVAEAFAKLGISPTDQQKFDQYIGALPAGCTAIDYCCASKYEEGSSQYQSCVAQQERARLDCLKEFTSDDGGTEVSCANQTDYEEPLPETNPSSGCQGDDEPPPTPPEDLKGKIYPQTARYLYFKLKREFIEPNLDDVNTSIFYFMPDEVNTKIACSRSSATFKGAGTTFKYNYLCGIIDDECDYIIPRDFTAGEEFLPGSLIDMSPLVIAEKKGQAGAVDSTFDIRLYNEKQYRNIVTENTPVSDPLATEYDTFATPNFFYSHVFSIKGDICSNIVGDLFTIIIDGTPCLFRVEGDQDTGFYIRSSCYGEIRIKPGKNDDDNSKTVKVTRDCYDGNFSCSAPGIDCGEDNPCTDYPQCSEEEFDPTPHIPQGSTLVSVQKSSEYIEQTLCRYCGDPSCNSTIRYYEEKEEECHCPSYATLSEESNRSFQECTYPAEEVTTYRIEYRPGEEDCNEIVEDKRYLCNSSCYINYYDYQGDDLCTLMASCFNRIGPTDQSEYEEACPDAEEEIITTTLRRFVTVDGNDESKAQYYATIFNAAWEEQKKRLEKQIECNSCNDPCREPCEPPPPTVSITPPPTLPPPTPPPTPTVTISQPPTPPPTPPPTVNPPTQPPSLPPPVIGCGPGRYEVCRIAPNFPPICCPEGWTYTSPICGMGTCAPPQPPPDPPPPPPPPGRCPEEDLNFICTNELGIAICCRPDQYYEGICPNGLCLDLCEEGETYCKGSTPADVLCCPEGQECDEKAEGGCKPKCANGTTYCSDDDDGNPVCCEEDQECNNGVCENLCDEGETFCCEVGGDIVCCEEGQECDVARCECKDKCPAGETFICDGADGPICCPPNSTYVGPCPFGSCVDDRCGAAGYTYICTTDNGEHICCPPNSTYVGECPTGRCVSDDPFPLPSETPPTITSPSVSMFAMSLIDLPTPTPTSITQEFVVGSNNVSFFSENVESNIYVSQLFDTCCYQRCRCSLDSEINACIGSCEDRMKLIYGVDHGCEQTYTINGIGFNIGTIGYDGVVFGSLYNICSFPLCDYCGNCLDRQVRCYDTHREWKEGGLSICGGYCSYESIPVIKNLKDIAVKVAEYTPLIETIPQDLTFLNKIKHTPPRNIEADTETVDKIKETYTITYNTSQDGDNPTVPCDCETYRLNFAIQFNVYPNFIKSEATGFKKDLCINRSKNYFECPTFTFTKHNPSVIMTDSVSVTKKDYFIGGI